MKGSETAAKLGIPSSTIQRRRAMLEGLSVLHQKYDLVCIQL
jgi:hypothetical protein